VNLPRLLQKDILLENLMKKNICN